MSDIDAVERAARVIDPDAWDGKHYVPEYRPMARAVARDKARAALAAAGARAAQCLDEHDPDGHGTVQCGLNTGHGGAHRSFAPEFHEWRAAVGAGESAGCREQVLAWADEAPEGTAGLDLLRQIVSTAPGEAVDREVLAADKNGEGCPLCEAIDDDLCAYHRGYDDGWTKGRAFTLAARGES